MGYLDCRCFGFQRGPTGDFVARPKSTPFPPRHRNGYLLVSFEVDDRESQWVRFPERATPAARDIDASELVAVGSTTLDKIKNLRVETCLASVDRKPGALLHRALVP